MDLNFKKCTFGEIRTVLDTTVDNSFDFDVTLPDYFPDIQRILKCTVTPGIGSSVITDGRVSADGAAVLRVIYSSENKRIYCYEQNFSFGKSVEDSALKSNSSLISTVNTDFVNCRATGQRKLNIEGVLSIRFLVKDRVERSIICGCDDENIQLKSGRIDLLNSVGCSARSFVMSEVAKLPDGYAAVDKVLSTSAVASTDGIKAVNGKILIKGDLSVDIVYSGENDENSSVLFSHSMPISQIIESEGAGEDSESDVFLKICNLTVNVKNDANSVANQLEISAKIDVFVISEQRLISDVIDDAYSMTGNFKGRFENVGFKTLSERLSDRLKTSRNFDFGAEGITSLVSSWCSGIRHSQTVKDNAISLSGKMTVMMLFLNGEGEPSVTEREVDFDFSKKLSGDSDNILFDPVLQVGAFSCTMISDKEAKLQAEIIIDGTVYSYVTKKILIDASLEELEDGALKKPSVVIYFAEEGEDIWDIAGRYKTTVEKIKTENNLKDSMLKERQMIVIPSAK